MADQPTVDSAMERTAAVGSGAFEPVSRLVRLFGTDEAPTPMRRLRAGALSADFDRGNLRYVRWNDTEVVRGIAFVVRDSAWGTYDPQLDLLEFREERDRFSVTYAASCAGQDGDLLFRATISGSAAGIVTFEATGGSEAGFATNRTGFVVLHPLEGTVGRELIVTHASGGTSTTVFPIHVQPRQPVLDIREMAHEPLPGLRVSVCMDGDVFEMEDQRNWTDASFKTYSRPLARGFPYRIEPGETVAQKVTVHIDATAFAAPERGTGPATVVVGGNGGMVPRVGLFLPLDTAADVRQVLGRVAALRPSYLLARIDLRRDDVAQQWRDASQIAADIGCPLHLEAVIPGSLPGAELVPLIKSVADGPGEPDSVFVVPARLSRGGPPRALLPDEADLGAILAAARAAFPYASIGTGVASGFAEINRNRPPPAADFVTHSTRATIHAADDISVMETLEALPHLFRSLRAFAGEVPYRLNSATIGLPDDAKAAKQVLPPSDRRIATAAHDPRQRGLFAAAFALGYVSIAARHGVEALSLAAPVGPFGIFHSPADPSIPGNFRAGEAYPLAVVVAGVSELAGLPRVNTTVSRSTLIAALAAERAGGTVLWLANLGLDPVTVSVTGRSFSSILIIDAAGLAVNRADKIAENHFAGDVIKLDSYAVCRLDQ